MSPKARQQPPKFISRQVVDARRFYLNLRPSSTRELTVVCGGWERCAPDYHINRDAFPYLTLECVFGGRGTVTLKNKTYPLVPGSVFAYSKEIPHQITTDPDHPLSKYFVNFSGNRGLKLLRDHGLAPGTLRTITLGDAIHKVCEDLVRAGERSHPTAVRLSALYLEILLLTINDAGEPSSTSSQRAFLTFTKCRQYLEENFLSLATVEQAADACHVDVAYFCRLFARFARQTPYRFLQRLKMNHAASLLETGQNLVRETADACGMDAFHFSRAFKRVHGLSPSAFMNERLRQHRKTIV